MLPDSLIELFELSGADDFPQEGSQRHDLAALVHASMTQATLIRTASTRFAHANDLNLVDFNVLGAVVAGTGSNITVTPGYISEQLALSASTLTSILERLTDRGLLMRDRDESDKRRIAIYYTEEAAHLILRYYREVGRAYEEFFGGLDADALAAVTETAKELNRANARAGELVTRAEY